MTNYYFPIIYIVPLISIDGQASPRLFIAPEIRHEKISYSSLPYLINKNVVIKCRNRRQEISATAPHFESY